MFNDIELITFASELAETGGIIGYGGGSLGPSGKLATTCKICSTAVCKNKEINDSFFYLDRRELP